MKNLIENYKDYLKRGDFVTTAFEHGAALAVLYFIYALIEMLITT